MKVKDIMSSPVYLIASNEPISRARNLMLKHGISRLVVIENDMTKEVTSRSPEVISIGVVTKTDISERLDQAEPKWRRRPIDNIPIKVVMSPDPLTIHPDATPRQAAEILLENNIHCPPIHYSSTIHCSYIRPVYILSLHIFTVLLTIKCKIVFRYSLYYS